MGLDGWKHENAQLRLRIHRLWFGYKGMGPLKPSPVGLSQVYFGFIQESKKHLAWALLSPVGRNLLEILLTARPLVDRGHLGFVSSASKTAKSKVTKKWCNWKKKWMSWSKSIRNDTHLLIQFSSSITIKTQLVYQAPQQRSSNNDPSFSYWNSLSLAILG